MQPFPIEELVDRVGSRFSVVVAAAKRAKQIKEGALPLVNLPTRNPLTIALHEIAAGLVQINEEVIIQDDRGPGVVDEGIGELAAPEVVESLIGKAGLAEDDISEDADDDYDADLDEDVVGVLDEETEDEEEEEEEEDLELDEGEDDWEEEEASEE